MKKNTDQPKASESKPELNPNAKVDLKSLPMKELLEKTGFITGWSQSG